MAGGTRIRRTPFASVSAAKEFQANAGLLTWEEVRLLWFYREGELVTRNRIWQIGRRAEEKLAERLADLREEVGA